MSMSEKPGPMHLQATLNLPDWVCTEMAILPSTFPSLEERMRTVIHFARKNAQENTGGPFAAGVFEQDSGKLVAMGVNRVVPLSCSSAHAEIVALSLAQQKLGQYDLGAPGLPAHELVVNWLPCAMCYGAVIWSGIRSLVVAGSGPELEEITGFDEGPRPLNWQKELTNRGISFRENILREEACLGFKEFAASSNLVYNARQGKS